MGKLGWEKGDGRNQKKIRRHLFKKSGRFAHIYWWDSRSRFSRNHDRFWGGRLIIRGRYIYRASCEKAGMKKTSQD